MLQNSSSCRCVFWFYRCGRPEGSSAALVIKNDSRADEIMKANTATNTATHKAYCVWSDEFISIWHTENWPYAKMTAAFAQIAGTRQKPENIYVIPANTIKHNNESTEVHSWKQQQILTLILPKKPILDNGRSRTCSCFNSLMMQPSFSLHSVSLFYLRKESINYQVLLDVAPLSPWCILYTSLYTTKHSDTHE